MEEKDPKKVKAGKARSEKLSSVERKELAIKAANSRWDKENKIPKASYTGELKIGEMVFPCSVLSDGVRILTQGHFMEGMGMHYSGYNSSKKTNSQSPAEIPIFLRSKQLEPFVVKHFKDLQFITVRYRTSAGQIANGILADIIPVICDIWIDAQEAHDQQKITLES